MSDARPVRDTVPQLLWAVEAVFLLCIVALAAQLRWEQFAHGYTSDELSNIMVGSAAEIYDDPEAGVNPPLLRLLTNVPLSTDALVPVVGRWWSFVWSLLAVVSAWGVGRAASGGRAAAGLLSALLLAVHPLAVVYGALYRAYAWWSGAMLLHLWAGARVLASPRARGGWVVLGATAIMLPWIHYMALPVLLAFAGVMLVERRWGWASIYGASFAGILPMAGPVLSQMGRRTPPGELPDEVLAKLVALDLTPPMALANPMSKMVKGLGFETFIWPLWMSISMMGMLVAHALFWRRLNTLQRCLSLGSGALLAVLWGIAHVQNVRDPTVLMVVTLLGPLLVVAPMRLAAGLPRRLRVARWPLLAMMVWWLFDAIPARLDYYQARSQHFDGLPDVVERLPAFDAARAGGDVWVHPAYLVPSVWFYLEGTHVFRAPVGTACAGMGMCVQHEGVRLIGVDRVADGAHLEGLLLSFEPTWPEGFASECVVLERELAAGVWRCGGQEQPAVDGITP
ncbi:MAG: hypothetical protein ACON5B_13900 [Myxococcota bacterium]